ncbi:MAG: 3-methyl-2-oxobutanoate hydroxymethyltransferase, partial [Dehalococcoidia bacterium]
ADYPDAIEAIERAGIPVWGQFGITPQTAQRFGGMAAGTELALQLKDQLLREAKVMEEAGASVLDFTNSGEEVGSEAVSLVSIPVIGGLGGGPWMDGRIRVAYAAVGYMAASLDSKADTYANVAQISLDAISSFADDVRGGRQIRGGGFVPPTT